jgi:Tol biopolymer transport system component
MSKPAVLRAACVAAGSLVVLASGLPGASLAAGAPSPDVTLVSKTPGGLIPNGHSQEAEVSGNGRYVVYSSHATDIASGDVAFNGSDVFRYDTKTGATRLISKRLNGAPSDKPSLQPTTNATGRFIVYKTFSRYTASGLPRAGKRYVLYDAVNDTSKVISQLPDTDEVTTFRTEFEGQGSLSANGRYFDYVGLVDPFSNTIPFSLLRYDRVTDTTEVLVDDVSDLHNSDLFPPRASAGGRYVAYWTSDGGSYRRTSLWRLDVRTGQSTPVNVAPTTGPYWGVNGLDISDDGRYIAYSSDWPEPSTGTPNQTSDVFLYDATTGSTTAITANSAQAGIGGRVGSISGDGSFVAFSANDDPASPDGGMYLYDLATGNRQLISQGSDGEPGAWGAHPLSVSDDSGRVAFFARGGAVSQPDPYTFDEIYLWTRP